MIPVDTGALYALADPADSNHERARTWFRCAPQGERLLVTPPVLVELFILVRARTDTARAFEVVERVLKGFELLVTEALDFESATDRPFVRR